MDKGSSGAKLKSDTEKKYENKRINEPTSSLKLVNVFLKYKDVIMKSAYCLLTRFSEYKT